MAASSRWVGGSPVPAGLGRQVLGEALLFSSPKELNRLYIPRKLGLRYILRLASSLPLRSPQAHISCRHRENAVTRPRLGDQGALSIG